MEMGRSGQSGLARAAASVKVQSPPAIAARRVSAVRRRPPVGRVDHDQRIERQHAFAHSIDRHRVEIDLLNFRPRRKQRADPLHDHGQRRHIARRLAAHAAQQRRGAKLSELVRDFVEIEAHRQ
jgi:hypothetical protein